MTTTPQETRIQTINSLLKELEHVTVKLVRKNIFLEEAIRSICPQCGFLRKGTRHDKNTKQCLVGDRDDAASHAAV